MSNAARSFQSEERRPLAAVTTSLLMQAMDDYPLEDYLRERSATVGLVASLGESANIPVNEEKFVQAAGKMGELMVRLRAHQPARESDFTEEDRTTLAQTLQFVIEPLFMRVREQADIDLRKADKLRGTSKKHWLEALGMPAEHVRRTFIEGAHISEQETAFLRQCGTDMIELCDHLKIPLRTHLKSNFTPTELDSPT